MASVRQQTVPIAIPFAFIAGLVGAFITPACWCHDCDCGDGRPLGARELDMCEVWVETAALPGRGDADFIATMTTSRDRVVILYEQDGFPVEVVYRVEYWERVRR